MKTVYTSKEKQIYSAYILANSGARGSEAQAHEIGGM